MHCLLIECLLTFQKNLEENRKRLIVLMQRTKSSWSWSLRNVYDYFFLRWHSVIEEQGKLNSSIAILEKKKKFTHLYHICLTCKEFNCYLSIIYIGNQSIDIMVDKRLLQLCSNLFWNLLSLFDLHELWFTDKARINCMVLKFYSDSPKGSLIREGNVLNFFGTRL